VVLRWVGKVWLLAGESERAMGIETQSEAGKLLYTAIVRRPLDILIVLRNHFRTAV